MAQRQNLEQLARTLNSSAIHLLRGLRAVDRQSGLTPARLSALSVLVFGGPNSVGRLAGIEDVASPTMTRIVDGLVALKLAKRSSHPMNGRISVVSATAKGEELMRAAAVRRVDVIVQCLRSLEPKERSSLVSAEAALAALPSLLVRTPPVGLASS